MFALITQLIKHVPLLANEQFSLAPTGTRHRVWLSNNYVVRSHNQPSTVLREAALLKSMTIELAPKVVWAGMVDNLEVMVERRLAWAPADTVWPSLSKRQQSAAVVAFADWLSNLHRHETDSFSAVQTTTSHSSWTKQLMAIYQPAINTIKDINHKGPINELWKELQTVIKQVDKIQYLHKPVLVHGDPIIHNILINGGELSGVIDWEFSLFGDPFYDYARLLYYRDCALAYGSATTSYHGYETAFYQAVWDRLSQQDWFDQARFTLVFPIYRALFYSRSLAWAITSNDAAGNAAELLASWQNSA